MLVAFGGLGTLLGPLVGAGVFAIVDERLSSFELREVLYGVFLIAIFLAFRRGSSRLSSTCSADSSSAGAQPRAGADARVGSGHDPAAGMG